MFRKIPLLNCSKVSALSVMVLKNIIEVQLICVLCKSGLELFHQLYKYDRAYNLFTTTYVENHYYHAVA